jgi:hypothetical protein
METEKEVCFVFIRGGDFSYRFIQANTVKFEGTFLQDTMAHNIQDRFFEGNPKMS